MGTILMSTRKEKRVLQIGKYKIGGDNPIVVQSMTNTDTCDALATLKQIDELAKHGCEVVRLAVLSDKVRAPLEEIIQKSSLPLIADIHFDYRLAIMAMECGIHGLRINPGNIIRGKSAPNSESVKADILGLHKEKNLEEELQNKDISQDSDLLCVDTTALDILAKSILEHNVPVRVGVNSGSIEKDLLKKYQGPTAMALVESALRHTTFLEERGVTQIKVSLKSSSVINSIEAYRLMHEKTDYPLHLGITEAGSVLHGAIKSAMGIGNLLMDGIGDTIRVSLTANPVEEMEVAYSILRASGRRNFGVEVISCPTCGRTEIDLISMARQVESYVKYIQKPLKIAVMGCVVNGPGEAREADIGIAGSKGRDLIGHTVSKGVIFKKGKIVRTVHGTIYGEDALMQAFLEELNTLL